LYRYTEDSEADEDFDALVDELYNNEVGGCTS
jgi:hypothetical protein